jgi:hypothetical protein
MLITVQFPIFDARGLQPVRSARLAKPNWPLPILHQQFVRGFGGIIARKTVGLSGFFSEDRVCNAENALRFASVNMRGAPLVVFRRLFADGDVLVKFEVGFSCRTISGDLHKVSLSSLLTDVLATRVLVGPLKHMYEGPLANAGKPIAQLYYNSSTYRTRSSAMSFFAQAIFRLERMSCSPSQPLIIVTRHRHRSLSR